MTSALPEAGPLTGSEPGDPSVTRPRVAVIFGGTSSEHAISCLTAGGVLSAIDRERYDVIGVGITKSGRWIVVDDEAMAELRVVDGRLPELTEEAADALLLRGSGGTDLAVRDSMPHAASDGQSDGLSRLGPVDVAFALLHGPYGEDGTIQGLFEMMGTRYVGAGVLASAVGMDKVFMKLVLAASGVPIGPFVAIRPAQWHQDPDACLEAVAALHYPVFVKPSRGGSSLGISRVDGPDELVAAIEAAQRYDPKVIVEEGITGAREFECGVLGDPDGGAPAASVIGEVRLHSGFYDFDAKYLPSDQVELDVPADVDADIVEQVQRAGGEDLRGPRLRRSGAGRRVLHPGPEDPGQRDQHHAGLHRDLDVSAAVGRQRSRLSRTGGSAVAARPARPVGLRWTNQPSRL